MIKSVRTFAFVAVLALVAAPSMKAETMGCNPRPKSNVIMPTATVAAQVILAYFGL